MGLHLGVRCDELIALAVDVDDFNAVITLQVLTELGDVNVHSASVEVVVVNPNSLERIVTLQNLVCMCTEQAEQFAFLRGKLRLRLAA